MPENDVNFYDYDGERVASYSKADFLALNEMPANPSHQGLTAQGWNWSLADAKSYVTDYGMLDIGQMYVTDDGKTRIYIKLEEGRLSPYLGFGINGTATIDWGDGSTSEVTGTNINSIINTLHNYSKEGNYIITIDSISNIKIFSDTEESKLLWGNVSGYQKNGSYNNCIKKIELGNNIDNYGIGKYAFGSCYSLESITMPKKMAELTERAFYQCFSLKSLVISDSTITIGSSSISACNSLKNVTISNSVTNLAIYMFNSDRILKNVIIPSGIKTITQSMCSGNNGLEKIIIPNSITAIEMNAFSECLSLSSVKIPSSVANIGSSAFSNCPSIAYYDFSSHEQIPTIGSNAFYKIASDCKIIVPDELYDDWIVATNWSTYASRIVKASEA